ncbi:MULTISPECIES: hypothetical protein [unclassified Corynebacterium]|uniref:hypothetical protein n=1 Tax=unclassified Corynebacterium TaxID=2624378 RepID=UPI0029C9C8CC|nr:MULTISPECIES: hypothetical protein [unclassified Corynebacterium]WPF65707.1 hypothetical protein OLX12_09065 [Corynebacterium sp. 22KM0430]WPF68203.1 hypothetical protein OLW90_09060 [Corynebacterium sp. 21KM1197]
MLSLDTLYRNHEEAKARRWEKNQAQSGAWLTSWRNRTVTLRLVFSLWGLGALALVLAVIGLWWMPAFIACLIAIFLICVPWTLLRITINSKDDAPATVLDEYENSVVNFWNRITLRLLSAWGFVFFLILMFTNSFSLYAATDISSTWWNAILGEIFLIVSLLITTLPAVGYALTFHTDTDKE